MPPSGEGANLAAHPDDIEAALAAFETAMFARSQAEAVDAHEIQELCLGGDSRASR